MQLLHIVVHEAAIGKSVTPLAEPAGRRCTDNRRRAVEIAEYAGVSRAARAANRYEPAIGAEAPQILTCTCVPDMPSAVAHHGTHSSWPALMPGPASVLAVMISWTTVRGSADGSAAAAIDQSVCPGCTTT